MAGITGIDATYSKNAGQALLDFGKDTGEKIKGGAKKVWEKTKEVGGKVAKPFIDYGETVKDTVEGIKEKGLLGEIADEAKGGVFGEGVAKIANAPETLKSGFVEETEEQKAKRKRGAKERENKQKADIEKLKTVTQDIEKESVEESRKSEEERLKSVQDLLSTYVEGMDKSKTYNELPKTIMQAYKSGKFGDPMTDEKRNAYRKEMQKPKDKRDSKVIEDYQKAKEAQQARNWYILNAIGTGMMNVGTALKGGRDFQDTEWNKLQGGRMAASQQRYNELLDAKADSVIQAAKHKQGFDEKNQEAFRALYNDKRLQPILNKLDTDSQVQLIDLMQDKAGAINMQSFINALAIQLASDPKGTVSSALGLVKDVAK